MLLLELFFISRSLGGFQWSSVNNLHLNSNKMEIVIDFRRHKPELAPLYIKGVRLDRVSTYKFLVLNPKDLSWSETPLK